ncbi:class I SAM-dependent methyltransferase [Candidatus Gottesmanbacteria bacterium]|nr:class I SAM-dependent methyltransferase [Candidatus Gottesmanbacteria bacterium]
MTDIPILSPDDWTDYELIDSGVGLKLERFGSYTVVRPDPRALWKPHRDPALWQQANARYIRSTNTEGHWDKNTPPPTPWHIRYHDMMFELEPTSFKHIGLFPEQAVNWTWLKQIINGRSLSVLNLFAYTGAASIAAAQAGARVTHLDSVKSTITWANKNAKLNSPAHHHIRWIEDDAIKFVTREQKRGNTYDGIILDPPRFGRGNKGEVWKLLDDLPRLLEGCIRLLSPNASFFLVNAYTADISAIALGQLVASVISDRHGTVSFGELALKESGEAGRLLPSGICARWMNL